MKTIDAKTLSLYLGCQCEVFSSHGHEGMTQSGYRAKLYSVTMNGFCKLLLSGEGEVSKSIDEVKPLLRPLSSMTEEEATEWLSMHNNKDLLFKSDEWFVQLNDARKTAWLISKHFDLFNLIESGQAIDSTKP